MRWEGRRLIVTEGDWVFRGIDAALEKVYGFPAGSGYIDARIAEERMAMLIEAMLLIQTGVLDLWYILENSVGGD